MFAFLHETDLLISMTCSPIFVFFQRLLADMESFKQQVQAVQMCQSTLQVPEEVMPNLAICRTALRLQQEASQLQHVAIQQCNILQVQWRAVLCQIPWYYTVAANVVCILCVSCTGGSGAV